MNKILNLFLATWIWFLWHAYLNIQFKCWNIQVNMPQQKIASHSLNVFSIYHFIFRIPLDSMVRFLLLFDICKDPFHYCFWSSCKVVSQIFFWSAWFLVVSDPSHFGGFLLFGNLYILYLLLFVKLALTVTICCESISFFLHLDCFYDSWQKIHLGLLMVYFKIVSRLSVVYFIFNQSFLLFFYNGHIFLSSLS